MVTIENFEKPKNCHNCPFNDSDCWCKLTKGEIDRDDYSCNEPCPIENVESVSSNKDTMIRKTLENVMRGLYEEIHVGELEYTTSEVYDMLEREIFNENRVKALPTAHWIKEDIYGGLIGWKCSKCGHKYDIPHQYTKMPYNCCPNCTAIMRKNPWKDKWYNGYAN